MSHRVYKLTTSDRRFPKSITLRKDSYFEKILINHNKRFESTDPIYPTERYYYPFESCNVFYNICDTSGTCNADGITLDLILQINDEWTCTIVYHSYNKSLGSCYMIRFFHGTNCVLGYTYFCVDTNEDFYKYKELWGYTSNCQIDEPTLGKPFFVPFIRNKDTDNQLFIKLFKQLHANLLLIEPTSCRSKDMNENLIGFMDVLISYHK